MAHNKNKLFSSRQNFSRTDVDQALQQRISVRNFPASYRRLICLRLPADVADILELRDTLNLSLEHAERSRLIPDYHEYAGALNTAVEELGIRQQHHAHKLVGMLSLFRELHYKHTLMSRNREIQLRQLVDQNRMAQSHSTRFGIASLLTAVIGFITLLSLPESGWLLKAIIIVSAIASLDFFQSLRILGKEHGILSEELSAVFRDRIESIRWETLSRNIASILGYRKDRSAFVIQTTTDGFNKADMSDEPDGFQFH